jgi:hypothetical protein
MRRLALLAPALLAGCTAIPKPVAQVAAPTPSPQIAAPAPVSADWRERPLAPGTWRYAAVGDTTEARFGEPGAPAFTMRCDRARRQVLLIRAGVTAGTLSIRTYYALRSWPVSATGVALSANDPALDQIAFSRGRFAVEADGLPPLYLPAWAEPSRVIEDCRG